MQRIHHVVYVQTVTAGDHSGLFRLWQCNRV